MTTAPRLLPLREVVARLGISKPTFYRLINAGRAPRPVRISTQRSGWVESEIDAMIAGRLAERGEAVAPKRRPASLLARVA